MSRQLKIIAFLAFLILINPLVLVPSAYRIWGGALLGGTILIISTLILYKEAEIYQEDAFVESEPENTDTTETEKKGEENTEHLSNTNQGNDE